MPWLPELFTAPALEQAEEKWQRELVTVPFFDGLLSGDFDALVGSFAGEPELHHPVRGRIRGARAFEAYVTATNTWLQQQNASIEDVEYVVTGHRGFAEVVIHLEGEDARVGLPVLVVSDKQTDGRIVELRIYYSSWPLRGSHAVRPPVLQSDPKLRAPDVIAEYLSALSAGDADAIVATFEADGYAREPAGAPFIHRGEDGLRKFYELLFSNGGGVSLEHCLLTDDHRVCALEYNVVQWGTTELPPQAGIAVYVRGESGKLVAARIYDDVEPPLVA
jgi:ketosteroid isomerase-like protein